MCDLAVLVGKSVNQDYKTRLSQLTNLVLVMFEYDTMVQPKESEVSLGMRWAEWVW